jgi:hypothetical protein
MAFRIVASIANSGWNAQQIKEKVLSGEFEVYEMLPVIVIADF